SCSDWLCGYFTHETIPTNHLSRFFRSNFQSCIRINAVFTIWFYPNCSKTSYSSPLFNWLITHHPILVMNYTYFIVKIASNSQPTRKLTPPNGVIIANALTDVTAYRYKLPENKIIPIRNIQPAAVKLANCIFIATNPVTSNAVAWNI